MKVSVIMPSYLGEYEGASKDREEKLKRAINTFIAQEDVEKELIVVSDGCLKTTMICEKYNSKAVEIKVVKMEKQPLFSGNVRSEGIKHATGDIICYLDSDDMFGVRHLESIVSQFKENDYDWCYYNDTVKTSQGLMLRTVDVSEGYIGTSSIAHKNIKDLNWNNCDGYGHDWTFVQKLLNYSKNYGRIYGTTYIVCHIPNLVDDKL